MKYGEPIVEFMKYNNNPVYTYTANKSHDVLFVLAGSSSGTVNNLSYSFTGESLYSYTYPVSERVRMTAQIIHCNEGDTITLKSANAFECMFVLELN